MKYRRIGVGKLVDALYKEELSDFVPSSILRQGRLIHAKLGYQESITLARYFEFADIGWLILGNPDLIDGNTIAELKVSFSRNKINRLKEKGETQANIYAWMGDFPYYRCDIYSQYNNKLEIGEKKRTDSKKATEDVRTALSIVLGFEELIKKRKEIERK